MEAVFLQNFVIHVQDYTTQPRRQQSEEDGHSLCGTISLLEDGICLAVQEIPTLWNCLVQCSFEPATGPFLSHANPVCVLIAYNPF